MCYMSQKLPLLLGRYLLSLFVISAVCTTSAYAGNLVLDGNFTAEANVTGYNGPLSPGSPWTVTSVAGTGYGIEVVILPNGLGPIDPLTIGSPDLAGSLTPYFVTDNGSNTLSQSISVVSGNTYEVSFDAYLAFTGAGNPDTPTFNVTLGGTDIADFALTSLPVPESPSDTSAWTHFYQTFTATSTGPVDLDFAFNPPGTDGAKDILLQRVYVGDVVSAATPEPGSVALLLAGLGAMAAIRRRKLQR